ncbi:MAG: RDD family protein [Acidimicrobiia bacterium]|nr:RDD family protein [Acidimicrobiia bacterium]
MNSLSTSSVLPRRIAASLVDLVLVGVLWLLVLYRLAVRFEIAQRQPDGTPIYSDFQRAELSKIAESMNFGRIIGDFYYSIHGRGLILGLLALLIFSLIAWVLIPANTGWSLGHRTFGLVVTDIKGDKPPLDSYLRRYLVGAVDLFPYVIPGLLGWIVAARNENNQRLGDLSADTVVVDATATLGAVPQTTTTVIRPTTEAARGEGEGTRSAPEDRTEMVDVKEALAGHTQTDMSEDDYPVLDLEDTASPIPTVERDDAIPSLIESSAGSEFVASLNDHEESVLADGETVEELPEKTYAENWHFPEAQEAPVWTPEPSTNKGPRAAANDAEQATPVSAPIPEPATKSSASPSATGDPVWNEEWQAWLYWDGEGKKWLRHDPDKGWLPIGDSQKA